MNSLLLIVLVATGGALGSLSRWGLSVAINSHWQSPFPWATLCINVLGSSAFGLVYSWAMSHEHWRDPIRMLFLMGFMGAFTTFSTFSFETFKLLEHGKIGLAMANVLGSVLLCIAGTWGGMSLGRQIFQ